MEIIYEIYGMRDNGQWKWECEYWRMRREGRDVQAAGITVRHTRIEHLPRYTNYTAERT
jgi:hypothetical protein